MQYLKASDLNHTLDRLFLCIGINSALKSQANDSRERKKLLIIRRACRFDMFSKTRILSLNVDLLIGFYDVCARLWMFAIHCCSYVLIFFYRVNGCFSPACELCLSLTDFFHFVSRCFDETIVNDDGRSRFV